MGNATWQPKWWTKEQHESAWERVKEAMKRDWEQTKRDFGANAPDLDQDVDDTVKQAVGKDVIPPRDQPNVPGGTPRSKVVTEWTEAEVPMRYGYAAREHYGAEHADWNDRLEARLRTEWEEAKETTRIAWNDAKRLVKRGYERART